MKFPHCFTYSTSLYKSTTDTWLKGRTGMLPWHAIPFLKGLGMLNTNPCQNGGLAIGKRTLNLVIHWLRRSPIGRVNGRTLVRY